MMDVSFHLPMSRANGIRHCCLEGNLSMKAGYGLSSRRIDQAECALSLADLSELHYSFELKYGDQYISY